MFGSFTSDNPWLNDAMLQAGLAGLANSGATRLPQGAARFGQAMQAGVEYADGRQQQRMENAQAIKAQQMQEERARAGQEHRDRMFEQRGMKPVINPKNGRMTYVNPQTQEDRWKQLQEQGFQFKDAYDADLAARNQAYDNFYKTEDNRRADEELQLKREKQDKPGYEVNPYDPRYIKPVSASKDMPEMGIMKGDPMWQNVYTKEIYGGQPTYFGNGGVAYDKDGNALQVVRSSRNPNNTKIVGSQGVTQETTPNGMPPQQSQSQQQDEPLSSIDSLVGADMEPAKRIGWQFNHDVKVQKQAEQAITAISSMYVPPGTKVLDATTRGKLAAFMNIKNRLNTIRELYKKAGPGAVGLFDQYAGKVVDATGIGADGDRVRLRTWLQSLYDTVYAKSGAQINEKEMEILADQFPRMGTADEVFNDKLNAFEALLNDMVGTNLEAARNSGMFVPPQLMQMLNTGGQQAPPVSPKPDQGGAQASPAPATNQSKTADYFLNKWKGQGDAL